MALLIDGHNLIPHIPGIHLEDPDDEGQLIKLLQEFCRVRRKSVEVFFDRAPAGEAGKRHFGQVRAYFVRSGVTADEAIMAQLSQLGKRAKNVTVVSSDRQVQQAARAAHAKVVTSQAFSADLQKLAEEVPELNPCSRNLSEEEVVQWENLFKGGQSD